MFSLMGRPRPGRVLISFWCDSDNKNLIFTFYNVSGYFSFALFGHHQNLVI